MAKSMLQFLNPRALLDTSDVQGHFANASSWAFFSSGGRFDNGRCFATGANAVDISTFPFGTGFSNINDTGDLGTNYTEGAITCSIAPSDSNRSGWCAAVGDTGVGGQLTLQIIFDTRLINVWRGTSTGTALVASVSCPALLNQSAQHSTLQFGWKINSTTGFVFVRINGIVYVNLTGVNTQNTVNARWNRLNIGANNPNQAAFTDHLIVWDLGGDAPSTLPLDARVAIGVPFADITTDFTRNSGATNLSRVNSLPQDGDTTYNSSITPGNVDRYDLSNSWIPNNTTQIFGVQMSRISKRDDATPRQMKTTIHSGAFDEDGVTTNETSSYRNTVDRIDNDPATSVPWLLSDLQNAEISYTLVA